MNRRFERESLSGTRNAVYARRGINTLTFDVLSLPTVEARILWSRRVSQPWEAALVQLHVIRKCSRG